MDRIRLMKPDDLSLVLSSRNHPDIRKCMFRQDEISMEEHRRWFESVSQDANRYLLIFEKEGLPSGFVNLHKIAPGSIADWGFFAFPGARKGTGRLVCKAALNYAFTEAKMYKICGRVIAHNARSIQLHLDLGFCEEGVQRHQFYDENKYHDVALFGLLASDWHAKK